MLGDAQQGVICCTPVLEFPIPSSDHSPSHPLQSMVDNDNKNEDEAINTGFCQTWAAFLFDGSGSTSQTEVPPLNLPLVPPFVPPSTSSGHMISPLPTRLCNPNLQKQMLPSHKTTENSLPSATLWCRTSSLFKHKLCYLLWRTRTKELSFMWRRRRGWLQERGWMWEGDQSNRRHMHGCHLVCPCRKVSCFCWI